MPPRHGTSILIGEDLFSFPLSKVERQLQTWGSKFQVRDAACAWSDLLGFGTDFVKSGWKPNPATWQKIAERLQAAYSIHLTYPALPGNFMLLLNDGVVRTIVDDKAHAFCWPLASWVRDVVWAHVDVTSAERAKGYPGTRTIVTGGEHANYGLPAATMDDFASLATKEYPGMTKAAQAAGNPTIASNPAALQMNTAFSKAYILDDYGSEVGINGCGLFVDDSFFELVRAHIQADHKRFSYVEETRQDGLFRGVKDANSDAHRQWMMRFVLAPEPIKVAVASLSTTVWRVEKFYPLDGIPPGSSIDVPWYPSPPKKTQNPPDGALHPRDSEPAANTHVKHDPGPPPPPLLLSKGVTVESFRKLIASKDDNGGSHVLWVDHAGTIHLDLLREGQSAAAYEDEITHRMRFRYEAFGQGEGLMGPAAVEDVRFARDLLHIVERDWFHRTRGCVESF